MGNIYGECKEGNFELVACSQRVEFAIFDWSWSCAVRKIHVNPGSMTLSTKLQRMGVLQCSFSGPQCYHIQRLLNKARLISWQD